MWQKNAVQLTSMPAGIHSIQAAADRMAAQKVALNNTNITAEVFDLAHYEDLKEQYQIMSVPCMIVNDDKVFFGKKGIPELVDILEKL